MNQMKQYEFDTGQCRLNVAEGPHNGPPLVLLHGATSWWRGWETVLPQFQEHFHCFAPDLRGSGHSARTPGRYGVMHMAGDIVAFLDSLAEPAHILGHSFGGHVALALSALRPAKIRSLVIEDIPLMLNHNRIAPRPAGPGFENWLSILTTQPDRKKIATYVRRLDPHLSPGRQQARIECLALLDPDVLEVYVNGQPFTGYDPEHLFARFNLPTLLVRADPQVDTRMDEASAARATDLSPRLQGKVIPGAGHNVHGDCPDAFVQTVAPFLLSVS